MANQSIEEVTLSDFIREERARINKFVDNWLEMNKHNPEEWPLSMCLGDWDDQLRLFQDLSGEPAMNAQS